MPQENLPIEDVDYIELYTGNAQQSAFFYSRLFGFQVIGYSGLETGNRETASYILQLGETKLVVTGAYHGDHFVSDFVRKHGDGVRDIAFRVESVDDVYAYITEHSGTSIAKPHDIVDDRGTLRIAKVKAFGDTIHTLLERRNYHPHLLPGYEEREQKAPAISTGLTRIDHIAITTERIAPLLEYYKEVFDFQIMSDVDADDVRTERSSLMSKFLQNGSEKIKFPMGEPAPGKKKSNLQEFLDYYGGTGVNHIALLSDNIVQAVQALKENGFHFFYTPPTYYETLPQRVGEIDEDIETLKELGILVDRDDDGYLLQIFGQNIHDRPTLHFEIIQRKGSKGFGKGNIRALFESVEREQERRGNL